VATNPNWPTLRAEWASAGHTGYGVSSASYDDFPFTDVTPRTIANWGAKRGRQYETNQVQAGSLNTTWDNRDGAFDPSNTSSPLAPNVDPYQAFRLRAQYPPTGINLLTVDQATSGEGTPYGPGTTPSMFGIDVTGTTTEYQVVASATAFQGAQAMEATLTAAAGSAQFYTRVALPLPVPAPPAPLTPNPTFTGGAGPWSAAGGTLAQSTAVLYPGQPYSGLLTPDGTSLRDTAESGRGQVAAGASYTAQAWVYSATGHSAAVNINWYSAAGAALTPTAGTVTPLTAATWTFLSTTAAAPAGAAYGTAVPAQASTPPAGALLYLSQAGLYPTGQAYSYTTHARCLTGGQNPSAAAQISWYTPGGALIATLLGAPATLTGAGGASFATLTASGAAPAGAGYALIGLNLPAGCTAAQLQADGLQWEASATASAFAVPNPWYPILTGGVERYPQSWTDSGTSGRSVPTVTDPMALLSQSTLPDVLSAAIYNPVDDSGNPQAGPDMLYKLADPSGSVTFADATGNRPPAQISVHAQYGPGTVTPGAAITSADAGGTFLGAPGTTVTTFAVGAGGTPGAGTFGPYSVIALPPSAAGILGPPATGGFTRIVAFRYTTMPTGSASAIWWCQGGVNEVNQVKSYVSTGGHVIVGITDAVNTATFDIGAVSLGDWHMIGFSLRNTLKHITYNLDGAVSTIDYTTAWNPVGGFLTDSFAGAADPLVKGNVFPFAGDIAWAMEYPYEFTGNEMTRLYTAWKTAYSGQSSGQRYTQILKLAGWTGPTAIDAGSSASLGPATDVPGLDALSALQAVVDTEAGAHYVDAAGRLTFKARAARYNNLTPAYTFGERTDLGEFPYEDVSYDADPTLICNSAQVTQSTTGQVFTAQSAASQTVTGTRQRQIANQSTSGNECGDQAAYVVSRYNQAVQRIEALKLHPSALPSLWPVCLSLELGTRIRVNRRPPAAPVITTDCFVESLDWAGDDTGEADLTVQCSPADLTPYGVFAALHTTLRVQAASGQAAAVLNPLPDAAANPFSAYVFAGMQMTLEPGTANSETLTVLSVSATAPGYASVTVTFTANLAKTHAASTVVCEKLPALSQTTYTSGNGASTYTPPGVTNPATWDSSAFGNVNFAY